MGIASGFLRVTIFCLVACISVNAKPAFGGQNLHQFVPPQAPQKMNILEGNFPEYQVADFYGNEPEQPDFQTQYDSEYEPPESEAPDLPDSPSVPYIRDPVEGPGVINDGGFEFQDAADMPDMPDMFEMNGRRGPNSMGGGANEQLLPMTKKGSSSASSVGIAFAVLAVVGLVVALSVFLVKKYKHRLPVIIMK